MNWIQLVVLISVLWPFVGYAVLTVTEAHRIKEHRACVEEEGYCHGHGHSSPESQWWGVFWPALLMLLLVFAILTAASKAADKVINVGSDLAGKIASPAETAKKVVEKQEVRKKLREKQMTPLETPELPALEQDTTDRVHKLDAGGWCYSCDGPCKVAITRVKITPGKLSVGGHSPETGYCSICMDRCRYAHRYNYDRW